MDCNASKHAWCMHLSLECRFRTERGVCGDHIIPDASASSAMHGAAVTNF